ncbi:hypothetical protein ACJDT4_18835 [Clostridium neuense]|uniref:Mannosyl-glycoprotein endo-beta-N-acetylglucosamidase-like domain-containing protein n=1 Tax=Clostridium neuense TaxID=1728934 RepID=A0ABW8TIS7_9CLOT
MESFMDELQDQKVISKNDVLILKQYINKKYSNYTQVQKLNVLTSSIHQILDKNIDGIEKEYTAKLKQDLLKSTLLKNGKTIFLIDIFNTCISKKDAEFNFYESVLNWVNSKVENKISISEFKKFDIELSPIKEDNSEINLDTQNVPVETLVPETIPLVINQKKLKTILNSKIFKGSICALFVITIALYNSYAIKNIINTSKAKNIKITFKKTAKKSEAFIASAKLPNSNLPNYFSYKNINENSLKKYLHNKNSLLEQEPYFSTILGVAKEFNLNPLVLFAITGQEQDFVPANEQYAKKIVNNPFNVFHSWQEYNTNLKDAAEIASRTVINLCKDRPKTEEPFHWINRKYAEDPKWGEGVLKLYNELEKNNAK